MDKEPSKKRSEAEVAAEIAKSKAEAAKALAEAEKVKAEARKVLAEARAAEADLTITEIELARAEEKRANELASNEYHHVYVYNTSVSDSSALACTRQLSAWHRRDKETRGENKPCDMTIVINSPGGSVIAGMALFDYIRYLSAQGHHITTVCNGYAASMGGILMQAGDTRIMGRESYILIHELAAQSGGKIGEMEDDVTFYHKICDRITNIFITRSGGKLSKAVFQKNWMRRDWWLDSDTALKLGIVDKVE